MGSDRTVTKSFAIYLFVIAIICIGSITPFLTYIAIVAAIVVGIILGTESLKNPSTNYCKGIILLLVFQNLAIGLGGHITGNMSSSLSLMTQVPFIVIAMEWGVLLISKRKLKSETKNHRMLFLLLIVCIVLSIAIGRGPFQSMLVNIRNMSVFFMAYEIALNNITSENELYDFEHFCFKLGAVVLVAGIVLLIGGFKLYEIIGIREVYNAKGSPLSGDALDDRFTTSLINRGYNRMGSTFYEPVNLGYFFSALTIASFFSKWTNKPRYKFFYFCLMLLGLMLSLGKGGYLITVAAFGYVIMQRVLASLKNAVGIKTFRNGLIAVVILAVTCFAIYYYKNIGAAVSPHFWGIIQTWGSVIKQPYGYGLGTGGNAALIYGSKTSWYASGGETQLMSFIYQIGIQGGLAFIICVIKTKLDSSVNIKKGDEVFIVLPFILLGMSLMQDNTFTPQCIVLFMFLQAGVKNSYYFNSFERRG